MNSYNDNENNNNPTLNNLVEIIEMDDNGKELIPRYYVDINGRFLWIVKSKEDFLNGKAKYIRCNESQRKEMLEWIADIKEDIEKGDGVEEYHSNVDDKISKKEYHEFVKRETDDLI